MVINDDGDDHYFSTVLKKHFNTGIVRFLGHRAKPLGFFTVCSRPRFFQSRGFLQLHMYQLAIWQAGGGDGDGVPMGR